MDDAFFILNNIPTTKHNIISNEQWGLKHRKNEIYRPLGCSALAYDPRVNKPKSNDRAIECIIMGTPLDSTDNEYLFLNLKTKQTIRSRSVEIFPSLYPLTYTTTEIHYNSNYNNYTNNTYNIIGNA
eukprot:Pgem_evm1s15557